VLDQLPQSTIVEGAQGRYEILGSVGRGGMGVVYRARRHPDGLIVALKEMRPPENTPPDEIAERRSLFSQEAELLLGLNHPNIVKGYEIFEWHNQPYFVMEFVNGVGLEKRLRETNAPAFEQDALTWGVSMARVLAYLHGRQPPIIYRDLKPENVILTPDGAIKFIDFGVARTYKARKAKDTVAIGTYGYAPPEQYGKGQTDARSDIYTLGATLYHLLTNLGPVPLRTPEPGSIMEHNPSVKPQTEQIIIRAMQQDREKRFASAVDMEAALNAALPVPVPPLQVAPDVPVAIDATQRTATPMVPPKARRPVQPFQQPAVQRPSLAQQPAANPLGGSTTSPALFCPHCGRGNKPSARFCAACGTALPAPAPQVVTAQPQPQVARAATPRPAARPMQQARFRISTPRGTWEFPFSSLPCRIGRRDPSQNHYPELDLADYDRGHASRRHAVVERRGNQYVLTDVGSVNGTLLNGVRLPAHRPQPLKAGDRVRIGDVEMYFEWI
jgi:serine/threonine-protein kinase